jgi:nicotinate phosphoribosyltransferase
VIGPYGPPFDLARSLLLTDLYQLHMVEAYLASGRTGTAVFELFVRRLPPSRGFLVAAGLESAVRFLLEARVDADEIAWLRAAGGFTERLLAFLEGFRFSGDVDALPEGTVFFADEPILRVTAPIAEAQLAETRLINFVHYQTLVATKAARMRLAAPGRLLVDFGLRRAHGGEAGLLAARASWIGGFDGTATVSASRAFGVPLYGTMAHSFIQAHDREEEAFLAFARARPGQTTFLVDTYDTEAGVAKVAAIAPQLAAEGIGVRGVRLDSGDLGAHARRARAILDAAGLSEARIVASGGLDEHAIERLVKEGAPIDAFGVGTSLVTSDDQPALDCAYKLKAYDGVPRRKRSEGKAFWPGAVHVVRRLGGDGRIAEDVLVTAEEEGIAGFGPLLRPVVRGGELVAPLPALEAVRAHAVAELVHLPAGLRRLTEPERFEAGVSGRLRALAEETDRRAG